MNPILAAGLLIGVLCGVWTFVMGFTGWYKDPVMLNAFFLVIVIEIAGLIWGLRQTAAQGRTYSGQVVAGTMMSIVAGLVIIGASLLFTTVAYPDYFNELNAAQRQMMQQAGKTDAEITAAIDGAADMQTPMANALAGFFGTFVTGVVASAIIGIWIRARMPGKI
ncbi:MAG TPA: DUF4199 domain-containing protein [Vicinamibacterales bacterium]|nr:DUF4199 domain-containing protein [Vicinamibacterales bacterium]